MSCEPVLFHGTFSQKNEAGLTCSTPSIYSGRSDGDNDTEADEQVELESHRGWLWWYWGRKGRGERERCALYEPNGLFNEREAVHFRRSHGSGAG